MTMMMFFGYNQTEKEIKSFFLTFFSVLFVCLFSVNGEEIKREVSKRRVICKDQEYYKISSIKRGVLVVVVVEFCLYFLLLLLRFSFSTILTVTTTNDYDVDDDEGCFLSRYFSSSSSLVHIHCI